MPKTYALVFGIAYVLVALIELIFRSVAGGLLFFTPVHNAIHWLTGVLGLLAYWSGMAMSKLYAQVFGVVFIIVTILGFAAPDFLATVLGYPVNLFYNIVHLITGLAGIYAGFIWKEKKGGAGGAM